MKTLKAFLRQRASLGCEMVAIRSLLTFYQDSIRQKRQPRPRFNPAFRLLWVLLSRVWGGRKFTADLMKPKTVLQRQAAGFLHWWRWKSRRKGGSPSISAETRALIRRLSRENVLWSAKPFTAIWCCLASILPAQTRFASTCSNPKEEGRNPSAGGPSCTITYKSPGRRIFRRSSDLF